jgi:hypothetical protein
LLLFCVKGPAMSSGLLHWTVLLLSVAVRMVLMPPALTAELAVTLLLLSVSVPAMAMPPRAPLPAVLPLTLLLLSVSAPPPS